MTLLSREPRLTRSQPIEPYHDHDAWAAITQVGRVAAAEWTRTHKLLVVCHAVAIPYPNQITHPTWYEQNNGIGGHVMKAAAEMRDSSRLDSCGWQLALLPCSYSYRLKAAERLPLFYQSTVSPLVVYGIPR